MENTKEFIGSLVAKRMTYQAIGKLLGISRQRVHQIYRNYRSIPKTKPKSSVIPVIDSKVLAKTRKDILGSFFLRNINPIKSGGLDRIREWVRIRDNRTCQVCLRVWKEGERRFDVHHLDEDRESTKDCKWDRENMDKMITLCHKCHLNLDSVRKKMTIFNRKSY